MTLNELAAKPRRFQMQKCIVCKIVTFLAGVGALNWLLVAVFQMNLVASILGDMTPAAKAVYILIGVCGVLTILSTFMILKCPACKDKK